MSLSGSFFKKLYFFNTFKVNPFRIFKFDFYVIVTKVRFVCKKYVKQYDELKRNNILPYMSLLCRLCSRKRKTDRFSM